MGYFGHVLYVSTFLMLYQAIANTDLSIISELTHQHGNNWAGPLSTALLFIGSGVGSLYNRYIGRVPYRHTFFIGSFGYTIFIGMGLVFMKIEFTAGALVLIEVGSFVGGLFSSLFYNSQYNYVHTLSVIDRQEVKYFGVSLMLIQGANLIGSLLSSLLIKPLGQFNYVLVMDVGIFVISLFFLAVRDPRPVDLPTSIISEEPEEHQLHGSSPYTLGGCFAFTGLIVAFIYNTFSIVVYRTFEDKMSDTDLNRLTFLLFIFEGIGEFLGGMFVAIFSNRVRNPAKVYLLIASVFVFAGFGITYLGSQLANYYILGVAAFVCGVCDCTSMSMALSLAGTW